MRKIILALFSLVLAGCSPVRASEIASTPTIPEIQPEIFPTATLQATITATSSIKAQCPKENSSLQPPDFEKMEKARKYSSMGDEYLTYLNSGGTVNALADKWKPAYLTDLTGDGLPELVIQELQPWHFFIYGCSNGKYQSLFIEYEIGHAEYPKAITITDANQNGLPEIVALVSRKTQGVSGYDVFEWDGLKFASIVYLGNKSMQLISSDGPLENLEIKDLDGNGTKELIWHWDIPLWTNYLDGLPFRKYAQIFTWNGKQYIFEKSIVTPAEYRFQAVQDGDTASKSGNYKQAIGFYEQAIHNEHLDWWSLERRDYEKSVFPDIKPTTLPSIKPDPNEYPNLKAYSLYRIMLLKVVLGNFEEAQNIYETLQKTYPDNQTGYVYKEMAKIFLEKYKAIENIQVACEDVINFANQNPEQAYKYIGYYYEGSSDYHGADSHLFFPQDICPFK